MPKGENPNSRANLKMFGSERDARKAGANGGKKSGEVRRALRSFKELDDEYTTDKERKEMLDKLKMMARKGNLKAFEIYATYMGLKPAENVKISTVEPDAIEKIGSLIDAIE